jgi:Amidohydrolase
VLDLAERKSAVIKVSGACTLSQDPYPFHDIWDPLARVFDAWGLDRCLWGTDWIRAYAVVNYEQAVEPFLKTDRVTDSERAVLMGGACAKATEERLAWLLSPRQGEAGSLRHGQRSAKFCWLGQPTAPNDETNNRNDEIGS